MATVTPLGITARTLTQYVTDLEAVFRGVFGTDLNVDPETPQGQLIGDIALQLSNADEALVRASNATSIFRSTGQQVDGLASILSIGRVDAERSQVTVTMNGVAGTLIPSGTRARTDAGDLFALQADVQLDGTGTVSTTMFSVETGNIPALPGTLVNVVDVVPGWETITNAANATPGRIRETDLPYRRRYFTQLFQNATTPIEAVRSAVAGVTGVERVLARENDTSVPVTVQNITIPGHTIYTVVEGGADNDIADQIRFRKPAGIPTDGTTVVNSVHPAGFDTPIRFTRVDVVNIEVDITIQTQPDFPGNGVTLIEDRIIEYINGSFAIDQEGFFETDGLQIAEELNQFRLFTPINSVQGHIVTSIAIRIQGGSDQATITPNLDQRLNIASSDDIDITVTT